MASRGPWTSSPASAGSRTVHVECIARGIGSAKAAADYLLGESDAAGKLRRRREPARRSQPRMAAVPKRTLFAMLDRYATMESLDLDETQSTRPTPSDSPNEIMDAISRRVDGKLVVRTCRATRKGKSSCEFDCPLDDTDQAGEAQTRLPGAVRAPRTASADCRRSPTRKSPRTSTRRRSTGWPHPSRSSNRPKPCTDGAHQTGGRTERNAQPARTGRAWRRAGLVVRNVLEQRHRAPRRSATRSHRAGRAPPHAAARGCPHRAERRSGARRHASGWPPSTGAHSAAPTMPVSAHTAARIDGRSGPTRRPQASTNRPGHPAVRYSGDRTEQHAEPDRVHTEQDTCLNAPGARRRFGRYARTTESALPRTQTLIFRNAPHGSAFACQAPQPDRGSGRQRLRIGRRTERKRSATAWRDGRLRTRPGGRPHQARRRSGRSHIEHHAFPELAECPAGPPTAFRTHGDACRQERTECNGRRNLPARAECNARDNCQYAPSVPAPETGRHVVCGNVGRRPRFGSLPSSAACLPDVGRARLPGDPPLDFGHRPRRRRPDSVLVEHRRRRRYRLESVAPLDRLDGVQRVCDRLLDAREDGLDAGGVHPGPAPPTASVAWSRHPRLAPAVCIDRRHRNLRRPMESAARHAGSRWPPHEPAAGRRSGLEGPFLEQRPALGELWGKLVRRRAEGKRGPVEVTRRPWPRCSARRPSRTSRPPAVTGGRASPPGCAARRRAAARCSTSRPAACPVAGALVLIGRQGEVIAGVGAHRAVVAARQRRTLRPRPGLPARHRRHLARAVGRSPRPGNLTVNRQVPMPAKLAACRRRRRCPPTRPPVPRSRPENLTVNRQVPMPQTLAACRRRRRCPPTRPPVPRSRPENLTVNRQVSMPAKLTARNAKATERGSSRGGAGDPQRGGRA